MNKLDWSLISGVLVLVIGTAVGTYLIHLSNRKANTSRIELLEETFTSQTKSLSEQSEKIKLLTKKVDSNVDLVKTISTKTNRTTSQISEVSTNVKDLVKINNDIATSINNQIKEKGTFNLTIKKFDTYNFKFGSNSYSISRTSLEKGHKLKSLIPESPLNIFLKIENNKLLINTEIRNKENELFVILNGNDWSLNKKLSFSINFDEKGLEIIDIEGYVAFQLQLRKNILELNFVKYFPEGVMVFSEKGTHILPYIVEDFPENLREAKIKTKHIFKHEGDNHLGKRL